MTQYEKIYVKVIASFDTNGKILPLSLEWESGQTFAVDRTVNVKFTPPEKVGGYLTYKYDCIFNGQPRSLYFETKTYKWFVEKQL